MSKLRVDQIANQGIVRRSQSLEDARRRVQLFSTSQIEKPRETFAGIGKQDLSAITGSNGDREGSSSNQASEQVEEVQSFRNAEGQVVELPRMNPEDRARAEAILAGMSPEQRLVVHNLAVAAGGAAFHEVATNPDALQGPWSDNLKSSSAALSEQVVMTQMQKDQEEMITHQVVMGLYGVDQNLQGYFHSLVDKENIANDVRTDLAELQDMLATWPDDGSTELVSYKEVIINDDGSVSIVEHRDVEMTKMEAQALAMKLDGDVSSLGQQGQMEMFMLQKMVEDYQKAENTLSNIMKDQHDIQKMLIGNARA